MEDHITKLLERLERLVALILLETMRDSTQGEKAVRLRTSGFSNAQIAQMLGTSPQVVKQLQYVWRSTRVSRGLSKRKAQAKKRKT